MSTHHAEWPNGHHVLCYCRQGEDHKAGDALCEGCGQPAADDELYECADTMPGDPTLHCIACLVDCGPCRDESAREWQAEHGVTPMRRS